VRAPRAQGRDLDALEEPGPPPASPDTEEALRTLASQARFLPEFGNGGEVRGIAVQSVVPGSTLDRLGLRSGDLVVSVAGHRVDDPASAQALRALPLHEPFAVEIVRAGAPATLRVPGGALVP
jgi:S1-C subfamily serine protease